MKKAFILFLLYILFVLSGCQDRNISLSVNKEGSPSLYVTHLKETAMSTVDLENGISSTVELPFILSSLTEINNQYLIASSKSEKELFAIDFRKEEMTPLLTVGEGVVDMVYNRADRLLYACNVETNSVQIIDMEEQKVKKEIKVGEYPVQLEIHNSLLYVLTSRSSEIYVIDLQKEEVEASFAVNSRPEGLLFDGSLIWIGGHGESGELNDRIYAYDPRNGKEVTSIQTGFMPVYFYYEKGNSLFYVLNHGDHSITSVDLNTHEVKDKLFVGENPNFMIADDETLYISSLDGDEIILVDKTEMNVRGSFSVAGGPFLLYKRGEQDE